jgi:lysophospholipase L1-like esterase
MDEKRAKTIILIFAVVVIGYLLVSIFQMLTPPAGHSTVSSNPISAAFTPTPTKEEPYGMYVPPKIPKKDFYRIAMVGDSMTNALGTYGGKLSEYLNTLYQSTPGHQRILIDNYAVGSTNILDLHEQMIPKITDVQPDLILIESFGYNPLSQLGLVEGQKKQTQVLEETMKLLTTKYPNTAVIFVATIAPNKETYAQDENKGSTLLDRTAQAEERMVYIKNHMAYAAAHRIPLIDIYDKTLMQNGDGNLLYINPNDHIHPSFAGLDFIDHEIANFIYDSQILPR